MSHRGVPVGITACLTGKCLHASEEVSELVNGMIY